MIAEELIEVLVEDAGVPIIAFGMKLRLVIIYLLYRIGINPSLIVYCLPHYLSYAPELLIKSS